MLSDRSNDLCHTDGIHLHQLDTIHSTYLGFEFVNAVLPSGLSKFLFDGIVEPFKGFGPRIVNRRRSKGSATRLLENLYKFRKQLYVWLHKQASNDEHEYDTVLMTRLGGHPVDLNLHLRDLWTAIP